MEEIGYIRCIREIRYMWARFFLSRFSCFLSHYLAAQAPARIGDLNVSKGMEDLANSITNHERRTFFPSDAGEILLRTYDTSARQPDGTLPDVSYLGDFAPKSRLGMTRGGSGKEAKASFSFFSPFPILVSLSPVSQRRRLLRESEISMSRKVWRV